MNYKIKDLPLDERPREKLKNKGAESLSNEEIIAILLRCGNKEESVKDLSIRLVNSLDKFQDLQQISYEELIKIKGIKEAKAISLLAAIELGKRLSLPNSHEKIKVHCAQEIFLHYRFEMQKPQEQLMALFLNTKNEVVAKEILFIGTQNKSVTHPREIFHAAIKHRAVKLVLMHNHPSGDPTPSQEDIAFTKNVFEIGKIMQIPLIDHIIVGDTRFFSFFDEHLL